MTKALCGKEHSQETKCKDCDSLGNGFCILGLIVLGMVGVFVIWGMVIITIAVVN